MRLVGPNTFNITHREELVNKYLFKIAIFCLLNKRNLCNLYNIPTCKRGNHMVIYRQKG